MHQGTENLSVLVNVSFNDAELQVYQFNIKDMFQLTNASALIETSPSAIKNLRLSV